MKHFLCGDDESSRSRPVLVIQDQYRHRGAESDKNDDRRVLLDVISMTAVDDITETINTLQQTKLRSLNQQTERERIAVLSIEMLDFLLQLLGLSQQLHPALQVHGSLHGRVQSEPLCVRRERDA